MKKKSKNLFSKKNLFFFLSVSEIIFLSSLYYKQYLANYLNHSFFILAFMLFCCFGYWFKKYPKQVNLIKFMLLSLSLVLTVSGIMIFNHNDKLSVDGKYIGIDISKWNKDVDFRLANQEIDYVIIRCGYTSLSDGTKTKIDPYFETNVKACQELAIPYGVYYYSLAQDETQAKKEADFVTSLLNNRIPQLGVFIDLEDEKFQGHLSNETLTNVATTFLDNIPSQNKKGIYANHYWWTTKLTDKRLDGYIKWKARYNSNYGLDEEYQILQYSETGSIKGIKGYVDLNMIANKYW